MKAFWKKYNNLRNQIFLLFSLVSIVIIMASISFSYNKFIVIYDEIILSQLEQTSVELNSAMEAKYEQISSIASQVTTDEDIQNLMFELHNSSIYTSNDQQQQFKKVLRRYYPYVTTIYDYRFYKMDGMPVFPVANTLQADISEDWIEKAKAAQGRLIWIGQDTESNRYSYAIKVIRSMNHSFESTGYLVLKLENAYFETQFENADNFLQIYDSAGQLIAGPKEPRLLGNRSDEFLFQDKVYKLVKSTSVDTNWTVYVAQSTNIFKDKILSIQAFLILFSAVVTVLAFLMSWIIASSITKPLQRLTEIMKINRKHNKMIKIEATTNSYEMNTLHTTYNDFITHIDQLIAEVYKKQQLQKQAELKAWQSQINPHFLNNTLNSFYWRLIEQGEDELAEQVLSMSELFKYSIHSSKDLDIVPLHQELHHIHNFLNLMKMRLGERLQWQIHCSPSLEDFLIPKLLLQPLIENAVIHGIEAKRTNGSISLTINEDIYNENLIVITIEDNGKGIEKDILKKLNDRIDLSSDNDNIAIHNIRMRLHIHYSEDVADSLHFANVEPNGTVVTIKLPKGALINEHSLINS